ncbi:ThuA domain-containing protein [Metabacillus arenae]|uniref:ThuA domain-containing protein n=1 Tax=Metabacillus arenae TaxID=2771434 RepID=A0A926NDJ2_9BACI|nr:ThuA domain-containing protein [Metabacillus arenae]MBD1382282.1 ThuA domain-containing protein [Metabacillus arenae]
MKKQILAILGDYYHEEGIIAQALHHAVQELKAEGIHIDVEYILADQLVERLQDRPDAVILSKANKLNPTENHIINWMDEHVEREICQYVKGGGGWFGWHSGLSSYEFLDDYYSMVRGKFDFHPPEQRIVSYIPTDHTKVISTIDRFEIVDEHYFVTCDEQNTNVFLQAISNAGSSIAGWNHEYGKGRVICLTPSHTKEGLLHRGMIDLFSQSLKWCLRITW